MKQDKQYLIKEAAKEIGVDPSTINFWEDHIGKLYTKWNGNERVFTEADILRLKVIRGLTKIKGYQLWAVKEQLESMGILEH